MVGHERKRGAVWNAGKVQGGGQLGQWEVPDSGKRCDVYTRWQNSYPVRYASELLTQGALGVPQDPLAPHRRPLGSSPDMESAIGNAFALVSGPLARL